MAYDKKESDMVSISGLWLNESKAGNKYMSGSLNQEAIDAIVTAGAGAKLMLFKVKEKKHEKSPDYSLMLAPPKDKPATMEKQKSPGGFDDF